MWRLQHDAVRHNLIARKPFMVSGAQISLKKGVPMKVAWPKEAVAAAAAAASSAGEGS